MPSNRKRTCLALSLANADSRISERVESGRVRSAAVIKSEQDVACGRDHCLSRKIDDHDGIFGRMLWEPAEQCFVEIGVECLLVV